MNVLVYGGKGWIGAMFVLQYQKRFPDAQVVVSDTRVNSSNTKILSEEIEKAVNYVFEARAECRFIKLIDVYHPESMPDFLLKAHENLDRVLYDIMGIPKDATSEQVLDCLHTKYLEMLNA